MTTKIENLINSTITKFFMADYFQHCSDMNDDLRNYWRGQSRAYADMLDSFADWSSECSIVFLKSSEPYTIVLYNGSRIINPFPEIYRKADEIRARHEGSEKKNEE